MTLRRARPKPRRAAAAGPESEPVTAALVPPYPPSWFDRFTAWVDRLPGPAWAFYLIVGLAAGLAQSALQWSEGSYPPGTFHALHFWTAAHFAYLFGLMHYLDNSAASALASFRPLLVPAVVGELPASQAKSLLSRLAYELTTLPPRPALVATLAGPIWAAGVGSLLLSAGPRPAIMAGTSDSALSTASVIGWLMLGNAGSFVLAYHTIHQLAGISRIYTKHARISIYKLQPLYSLSVPGALTAIGIMVMIYTWFATTASVAQTPGPVEIGLSLTFGVIAAATFGLPLVGAHRRLVAEKNRRLAENGDRFEAASEKLHRDLDSERLGHMDQLNKALASLELEQSVLRRVPTWPWEPGALRGLIAALMLPIVIWLIQFFLGRWLAG